MPKVQLKSKIFLKKYLQKKWFCKKRVLSLFFPQLRFAGQGLDLTPDNMGRLYHVINVPGPSELSDLLTQGFQDGFRFLRDHGLADCRLCMEVTRY